MLVDYSKLTDQQLREAKMDPVKYCEHFLGEYITVEMAMDPAIPLEYANAPVLQQRRIMRDFALYRMIAVIGANMWGKSHLMARLASWWFDRWDECMIVVTSTKMEQIDKNFATPFRELRGSTGEYAEKDNVYTYMPDPNNPKKQVVYTTAAKQESIAGWHYWKNKFFIFDEASGIHKMIYNAVFPMASRKDSLWGLFGNPLRELDEENYSSFKECAENPRWRAHFLDAHDHPNVIHGRNVIERGMDPEYPEMAKAQYGEDSVEYIARVLGRFAMSLASSLYGEYIDKVMMDESGWIPRRYQWTALGIDPAGKRSGDSTAIVKYQRDLRIGDSAEVIFDEEKANEDDICEFLSEQCEGGAVDVISCDVRGMGYFLPGLIRKDADIDIPDDNVYEYDGQVVANDKERFDTKKDEDAFDLKARMKDSVLMHTKDRHNFRILKHKKLYEEMGTRKYGSKKNRLALHEKKAGTGESPDRFEALLVGRDAMRRFIRSIQADSTPPDGQYMKVVQTVTHQDLESIYA